MTDLKSKIEVALEAFWDEQAIPVAASPESVGDYVAPMDSMSAVEVLIVIEEITGIKLKAESVIRKGGYDNKEHFVKDLSLRTLAAIAEVSK